MSQICDACVLIDSYSLIVRQHLVGTSSFVRRPAGVKLVWMGVKTYEFFSLANRLKSKNKKFF
jgi:hypothetical protein